MKDERKTVLLSTFILPRGRAPIVTDDPRVEQLLEELSDPQATPEVVCASCPEVLPVVRKRLRQMERLRADLDALFPSPNESPSYSTEQPDLPRVPGYEVEGVLGRGGMGVVFRARHLRLNRPVALKMVLAGPYAAPEVLERFLREAEAIAGLRHPNVVQVYDVGEAAGRAYFTMELVEGGSLARKLAGAPLPARQAAALVATVAEAIHVAHQGGIVHRDLTPANVLLTADGTPKVTDFGLAKRLEGGGGLTLTGAPMGTPSYMAPEQARGDKGAIGPAVDVYALGAILYECLTGRPPFRAETSTATIQQVLADDPVPPARLNRGVPRDLETICLKCLQKDPAKRYPTAAEFAADVERFSKHEPIQARPPGRVERCLRWVRRRPAAAALLSALGLLVAAGAVGAWSVYQQRTVAHARQALTDQEVRGVLERACGPLEEGWLAHDLAKLTEARAEGNRAADIARSGGASAAVRQEAEALQKDATGRLERAERNRALLGALQDVSVQNETLAHVHDRANSPVGLAQPNADELYGAAFRRWGLDVDGTAEVEVVARLGAEPDPVVQELVAGLDGWMLERRRNRPEAEWRRLYRVAERLDGSEPRRRMRALLVGGAPPRAEVVAGLVGIGSPWPAPWELTQGATWRALLELRREIDPRTETVLTVALLARAFAEVGDTAEAERVLRLAVTARPVQVVLLVALGKLLEREGPSRLTEAIGYYRAARSRHPFLGIALGRVLHAAGKADEAEEVLQELARQPAHDRDPALFLNLSFTLFSRRKYIEAEAASRKATHFQPDFAGAHFNLGNALLAQERYGEAEAAYRKTLDLKPRWAEAQSQLGNALSRRGNHGEAEAAYRKAIDLKPDLAAAYNNLGSVLMRQQRYGEAEAALRKAIDLNPSLAEAHNNLGNTLVLQGRPGEAEAASRKAIDLNPSLAEAYYNLGNALSAQGERREAEAAFRKSVDLKPDFAAAYYNLGNALMGQRRHREAEAVFRKTIDLKPDFAEAYTNLGSALVGQGRHVEAEAALRKAIALNPGLYEAHFNLGSPLMQLARFDEAAAALKKAGDLLPAKDPHRVQVWRLQQQCERCRALDARLPAILSGTEKPISAAEQIGFAQLCLLKKLSAAAARLYAETFAMRPRLAENPRTGLRYEAARSAALAGCGRGEDAAELGDAERARWRRQALEWLRADLTAWTGQLATEPEPGRGKLRQMLEGWQADPDLAGLRDPAALDRLPADERMALAALWADVAAVRSRAAK
jgi:serine/threonine-protein kinase